MSFNDYTTSSDTAQRNSMTALNDSTSSIRRRPPYPATNAYGTYESESLLRHAPDHAVFEDYSRRRAVPWYRQPSKLIMIATLAWIGGVMYLANLAHAILRSQKESRTMGDPVMGMSGGRGSKGQVNVRFGMGDAAQEDGDYKQWLESQNKYGMESYTEWQNKQNRNAMGSAAAAEAQTSYQSRNSGNNGENINVRFGKESGPDRDATYEDWLQYQNNNKKKYSANGKYGDSQQATTVQSDASASQEVAAPESQLLDSSVSTIDWPMKMGLASPSCTALNGCSPSNNVTILVVYGPEYHTHISEMAWQVAEGVHTALKSHIRHHPHSPIHGHILYGHTSNLTFLDVLDADAIIIGSPVYNGNIHPDVQNWINYWHIDADLSNKFGGAFVTAGGIHAGADGTIMSILRSMMVFQMMAVGGDSWTSPFGVAATMYEDPFGDVQRTDAFNESCYFTDKQGRLGDHLVHPYFLRKAFGLGERITNVTVAYKNSSYIRW